MGDRYILEYKCVCGYFDDDVYYAPTCGFVDWICPHCGFVLDLEEHTGISYADASNADVIKELISAIDRADSLDPDDVAKFIEELRAVAGPDDFSIDTFVEGVDDFFSPPAAQE